MHYNGPIIRPQTDAYSLFVEVTVGCTHNSCTFCNFYDGYPFRVAPLEQIEEDLQEAKRQNPNVKRIWASGGNPYALSTERLAEVGKLFQKYFPGALVSMYARVDDLCRKSVEEMKYLKSLGISDLVVGFECADDEVLEHVNKGYTVADILEGCKRLEEAGVTYRMIYLGGMGGKGHGEISAKRTVEVLNQLHPYYMYLNMVTVVPGTKLYEERARGEFVEAEERERLTEFITLLSGMKNEIRIFAAPNTTNFSFDIDLQKDKENVVEQMIEIRDQLTDEDEARLRAYRNAKTSV